MLDSIIRVTIDRKTTTPTQAGFGTPLIAAYFPQSLQNARVASYSNLTELTTLGFRVNDPVYLAMQSMLAQNPSPPIVKVGRRAGAPQQTITITPPASPVEGDVFTVSVSGYANSAFAGRTMAHDEVSVTAADAETATSLVTKIKLAFGLLNAATGPAGDWSWTAATTTLVIEADNTTMDGLLFGVTVSDNLSIVDNTPDPTSTSLAVDLSDINLYDPDWYGFCIDSHGSDGITSEVYKAAEWAESNKKQFVAQTRDTAVASASDASDTTSIGARLKAASFERTMLFYHKNNLQYICAAMLGRALPEDAGSITWAYKQLAGITSQNLTTTEQLNLEAKNVNFLTTLAGVAVTRYGTSSDGEYMDIIRGTDWLAARIQERVYALLIQNDKLPFTDAGIQAVRGEILAQLNQGISRNFIASDPEPTCTVPRASEVSVADKGTRTLNGVTFRATLAGAIHKVAIEGELTL